MQAQDAATAAAPAAAAGADADAALEELDPMELEAALQVIADDSLAADAEALDLDPLSLQPDPLPAAAEPPALATKRKSEGKKKKATGQRKSAGAGGGVAKRAAQKSAANTKRKAEDEEGGQNEDEHPFKVGAQIVAKFVDNTARLATIIERAEIASAPEGAPPEQRWRYYVHFHGLNRRMDEWILPDRQVAPPSVAAAETKAIKEARLREREAGLLGPRGNGAVVKAEEGEGGAAGGGGEPRTRRHKRKGPDGVEEELILVLATGDDSHDEHHDGLDEASLKEHEEVTKVKNVNWVEFGKHLMECWYFSPFPKEFYPDGHAECLYFCEFTMRFFRHRSELLRWKAHGRYARHPPGNEIYRDNALSMFEVDGADQRQYCQGLCYLAKLFLDHKTLYYDVDPFLYYVLCEFDEYGYHPVGYFSKEKYSDLGYNLACILTFPAHQRKGYGRVLISFSYELSKKEEKVGSPEKPLSDLGAVSYRSYWASVIIAELQKFEGATLSIMDLSKMTSIMSDDITSTLMFLGLLRYEAGQHVIVTAPEMLAALAAKHPVKPPIVDASRLHWTALLTDNKKDKFSIRAKKPVEEAAGA